MDMVTRRTFLAVAASAPAMSQDILQMPAPKADVRIPYGRDPAQF